MVEQFSVSFSLDFRYSIFFSEHIFHHENLLLARTILRDDEYVNCIVYIDHNVALHHPYLKESIIRYFDSQSNINLVTQLQVITGGEECKNSPKLLHQLYTDFLLSGLDRHSCVIAIGGGALLDLVGYASSTAHRGISLIRVPTTVLAQNDAGIGVKTAVNFQGRKNFLGTFCTPLAVFCDFEFLKTLSQRDKRAGLAEAVKVALIKDADFFYWTESHVAQLNGFEADAIKYLIAKCAELHANKIAKGGDPFETGNSRPLDYGHWCAHKLEMLSNSKVKHGEAVAMGMLVDTCYAAEVGILSESLYQRIGLLLFNLGFTLYFSELHLTSSTGKRVVFEGISEFREHLGGQLNITLLNDIGSTIEIHEINTKALDICLEKIRYADWST